MEGPLCLSKIICRGAEESPLCLSKIICRGPQSCGGVPCAYLRSFVEGPQAREDALCLSKIICRVAPKLWR